MNRILKNIEFKYFPIIALIAYVPFHLLEEALNNFPYWMSTHYNLPVVLSYPHWLINNSYFFITLLVGLVIFLKDKIRFLSFGVGILIWIFLNSMEHIAFSVIDLKAAPGIYTALIFLCISLLGFAKLFIDNSINTKLILRSIIVGIGYWIIPIVMILLTGNYWVQVFPVTD